MSENNENKGGFWGISEIKSITPEQERDLTLCRIADSLYDISKTLKRIERDMQRRKV